MGITSDEAKNMTDMTSARELVDYFRSFEYREIGERKINGVSASGIEVEDPALWAGQYEKGSIKLWVATSTLWPILIEREFSSDDGEVRVRETYRDFRWNPSLEEKDFEFEVPEGYGKLDFGEVQTGESGAIEGLRAYAKLSGGRYPGDPSFDTAASEIREDRDRLQAEGQWGPEEIKELFKLRGFCSFYAGLVRDGVEVEYNGGSVTARDYDDILMRWRLEDGRWRVIYGDLRAQTMDSE
jgi:hypothetical protein